MFRHAAGRLVQTDRNRLIVLNDSTGDVVWTHEEKEDYLCFPRVQEREGRVYVQAVESGANKIQGRWANLKTTALLCFDLEGGKLLWRSEDLKGANFGQSIVSGEKVFLFNPGGIGASDVWGKNNGQGNVACLDAADGKLLWTTPQKFVWGYNLLVRDGRPYFAGPDTLTAVDPAGGRLEPFWRAPYNNRCNRTSATQDWVIMGLGIFVDRQGVANVKSISRSGCAQCAFPANGMTYYTPNTCTCFTMLRGHLALSSEAEGPAVGDDVRLEPGVAGAEAGYAGKATAMDTAVSSEWRVQVNQGAIQTPAVRSTDGTRSYVAVTHEHRLECRDADGRVVWSFTAGGRISQPPTLDGDRVFFGSHDGYAYCLDAASGRAIWRFMGAPVERTIVSHGQLESAYPVYNVVMFEGRACFTAGLHPEVGAGIHAWGLDPATGAVAWHRVIRRSELLAKMGTKIAPNRVLNSPLVVDDRTLAITGLNFIPDETDEAIRQRMDTSSLGDKLRNLGWTLRGTPVQKR
jgi:outer membrane protein assembly factor BamB